MKKLIALSLSLACLLVGYAADQWGQVNISVAHIRSERGNSSELSSQELLGMPVKLLERNGDWWQVETTDGYHGWLRDESIVHRTPEQLAQWRKAPRLVVTAPEQIKAYSSATGCGPRDVVTDLVLGNIVEGTLDGKQNGRVEVTLPDGRKCWAPASALTPIEAWANQGFNAQTILDQAYSLIGTPYLWGAASVKALDCSGLSKTSYLANGIFLRRDAWMQALTGQPLDIEAWRTFHPGDLLFFGNKTTGKVTHVAIYDHDGIYVHSTGAGDRVRVNSLDPESPIYNGRGLLKAVRIDGMLNTEGIVQANRHPWLF